MHYKTDIKRCKWAHRPWRSKIRWVTEKAKLIMYVNKD